MTHRRFLLAMTILALVTLSCAGRAPEAEPGMKVVHFGHGEELQVATDVDWNDYTKIILHTAPVAFRENWKRDQDRAYGKTIRDEDVERIKTAVSDQFARVMSDRLSDRGGYEFTGESGPGVMRFRPNIVDLDVRAPGWIQDSIVESITSSRGSMRIELVIRDSVTDKLLAVAWQNQSDPRADDMEMTISVNNSVAFRLMIQNWANWLMAHLEEA